MPVRLSRSHTDVITTFIAHLPFVARRVELSKHDAAERHQRSLTLFVRQQTPELIEHQRPTIGGRGGEQ